MKRLPDATLLAARIVIGITFIAHGLSLLEDPSMATREYAAMGIPLAGAAIWVAAAVGIVGGLCFAVGLGLPVVAVVLAVFSLGALIPADGAGAVYAAERVPPQYVLIAAFSCLGLGFNAGRYTVAERLASGGGADRLGMRR